MNEDMNDAELLVWMEKRFGITKHVGANPSNDKLQAVETQLTELLSRCREHYKLSMPIPRIRMWLTDNKLNFMFFDKKTGKRILLGHWIEGKEAYYEH